MKARTVWILNHYAHPPDLPGGTRHYDFAREFVRNGCRVTIFAASYNHHTRTDEKLGRGRSHSIENHHGVQFVWIKTFPYRRNDWRRVVNWLSYTARCIRIGARFKETPEVIIGSSVHLFAGLAACILARIKRARFIFEVRDLWPQTLIEIGSYSPTNPVIFFFRCLEKFLYKRAEIIVSLLPRADDYLASLGIPRSKVIWIPNGVSLSLFSREPDGEKAEAQTFTVMYLGALGDANNMEVIIAAARELQAEGFSQFRFKIIGDGPDKERLMARVDDWGLRNVEFLPQAPKNHVPELMSEADAFILSLKDIPLYRYGISLNKLFDYMAACRPVIFCGGSVNNPVAEAQAGVTVPPDDVQALAGAVINLAGLDPEQRAAMGRRGRAYIKEHHDIGKLAIRFMRIFEGGSRAA